MTVRPILTWPDARLVTRAEPVPGIDADILTLVEDLFDTMYDAKGRGLAAPQVGDLRRVFVMDAGWQCGDKTPRAFINPDLRFGSGEWVTGPEGCLSLPGITAQVTRHDLVDGAWTGLDGEAYHGKLTGFEAICFQHELDHLDGIVTLMRVDDITRARLEQEYIP